jgi:hypothetical protein
VSATSSVTIVAVFCGFLNLLAVLLVSVHIWVKDCWISYWLWLQQRWLGGPPPSPSDCWVWGLLGGVLLETAVDWWKPLPVDRFNFVLVTEFDMLLFRCRMWWVHGSVLFLCWQTVFMCHVWYGEPNLIWFWLLLYCSSKIILRNRCSWLEMVMHFCPWLLRIVGAGVTVLAVLMVLRPVDWSSLDLVFNWFWVAFYWMCLEMAVKLTVAA